MSATFTCPSCRAVSHNPNDVENSYCGRCHRFWREIASGVWDMLTRTWQQLGEQSGTPTVEIIEEVSP